MTTEDGRDTATAQETALEREKLKLDRLRVGVDILKWGIGGIAIVIGFCLIRPREQDRLDVALKQELFQGYVSSQDSSDPNLWQRKLDLMVAFTPEADRELMSYLEQEQIRLNTIRIELNERRKAVAESASLRNQIALLSVDRNQLIVKLSDQTMSDEEKHALEEQQQDLRIKVESLNVKLANTSKSLAAAESKLNERGFEIEPLDDRVSQLANSVWKTTYVSIGGGTIDAEVRFDGPNGSYRAESLVGRLSEVEYVAQGSGILIKGRWAVQGFSTGYFWFNVSDDTSVFTGEWGRQPDKVEGEWNGIRVVDPA